MMKTPPKFAPDTGAGLLILLGSPLAQTPRRIGQALAKL
jgi:hypothetical protein